jgi:hypothetical protein
MRIRQSKDSAFAFSLKLYIFSSALVSDGALAIPILMNMRRESLHIIGKMN